MKYFYLLVALSSAASLLAQEKKMQRNNLGHVEVSEVVTVDSFSAAQLYFNSKLFLNSYFHNPRETAQIKDDKAQTVATKASFPVVIENGVGEEIKAKTFFTLIIHSKEGMYRYIVNDFYFAYTEETGITTYASFNDRRGVAMTKKQWLQVEMQTEEFLESFVRELKTNMQQNEILCKEVLQANKKKKAQKND